MTKFIRLRQWGDGEFVEICVDIYSIVFVTREHDRSRPYSAHVILDDGEDVQTEQSYEEIIEKVSAIDPNLLIFGACSISDDEYYDSNEHTCKSDYVTCALSKELIQCVKPDKDANGEDVCAIYFKNSVDSDCSWVKMNEEYEYLAQFLTWGGTNE